MCSYRVPSSLTASPLHGLTPVKITLRWTVFSLNSRRSGSGAMDPLVNDATGADDWPISSFRPVMAEVSHWAKVAPATSTAPRAPNPTWGSRPSRRRRAKCRRREYFPLRSRSRWRTSRSMGVPPVDCEPHHVRQRPCQLVRPRSTDLLRYDGHFVLSAEQLRSRGLQPA